jgi:hypothetical protein
MGIADADRYNDNYKLSAGSVTNYEYVAASSYLTVGQAELTAAAANRTIAYGATVPATAVTYSGFVNGENSSVIDTLASVSSDRHGVVNPGSYLGNYTVFGALDGNYRFRYVNGNLMVNGAVLPTVESAAIPATVEYNSQVMFDVLPPAFVAAPKSTVKMVIADPLQEIIPVGNKQYTITIIISPELAQLFNISQSNLRM